MARTTRHSPASFTLVELLISISIIAMLSATALFMLYGVQEHGRLARTKASVARIHEFIMERWETYLTRPLPMRIPPAVGASLAATARLYGVRELMRVQLPDRKSDLLDDPVFLKQPGTNNPLLVSQLLSYRRKAARLVQAANGGAFPWTDDANGWTRQYQGAECLYLILASIRDGDSSALDYFVDSEIGDLDKDGMPEVHDGWGRPIDFIRWAPGFVTNPGPDLAWGQAGVNDDNSGGTDDELEAGYPGTDDMSEAQPRSSDSPDPFDPRDVDTRSTFALIPLIISAGPDGVFDIFTDNGTPGAAIRYSQNSQSGIPNDPYLVVSVSGRNYLVGQPADANDANNSGNPDGVLQCWDNISNHLIDSK